MKIVIETIRHSDQRYATCGDYWWEADGSLQIRVSKMIDSRSEIAVVLHELVEATLCERRSIPEPLIMAFDIEMEAHPNEFADDPGHDPRAPYHPEHVFAEIVERLMLTELDLDWHEHEKNVERLFE